MIVVVAVTEKQVVINDQFNTAPVTGRLGIFSRVAAPTEIKPVIEIVGVYSNLDEATAGRARHFAGHPQCRYVQKVCQLDERQPDPVPVVCILCGQDSQGLSYCAPCNAERARALRESDPELLKEIAAATR